MSQPPARLPKSEVRRLLHELPDDSTSGDIQYHIHVLQKLQHGLDDVAAGRTISQEEFDRRMARWLTPQVGRF